MHSLAGWPARRIMEAAAEPGAPARPAEPAAVAGDGRLVHAPSAPVKLPGTAPDGGQEKTGNSKRRGTAKVIFEGSAMQAAVSALALADSSDDEPTPESSPRSKGRPRSRSASFASETVVDFRVTPSLQKMLDTLEKIGLSRHKTMFLRERITYDTLNILVEDDAKLAELGLAMGDRMRLHKELRPPAAGELLHRPVRRNSFDKWYGDLPTGGPSEDAASARPTPIGDQRAAAFIDSEYTSRGFQGSAIIDNIEDIQLGAFIAEGTSGGVYNAVWRGMSCAVKRFRFSKDDAALTETFTNEVFLLQNLSHDNLVRFYGACTTPPHLCILTELMTGSLLSLLYGSLARRLDGTLRELNDKRQAHILKGVATGMAFLHSHSVAHRDLKSANVLYDRALNVKLCDFAFSKFKRQLSGLMDSQVGTPAWMAPEVLRGDEYTLKCDVYSMGVICWEMEHREEPLKGVNQFAVVIKVGMEGHRLPIRDGCPLIWRDLMQACWQEPADRPSFAEIEKICGVAKRSTKNGARLSQLTAAGRLPGGSPSGSPQARAATSAPVLATQPAALVLARQPQAPTPEIAAALAAVARQPSADKEDTQVSTVSKPEGHELTDTKQLSPKVRAIPEGVPKMSRPGQGPASVSPERAKRSPRASPVVRAAKAPGAVQEVRLEEEEAVHSGAEPEPEPEPEPAGEYGRSGGGGDEPFEPEPEPEQPEGRRNSLIRQWSRRLSDEVSAAASIALEATISTPEQKKKNTIRRRNSDESDVMEAVKRKAHEDAPFELAMLASALPVPDGDDQTGGTAGHMIDALAEEADEYGKVISQWAGLAKNAALGAVARSAMDLARWSQDQLVHDLGDDEGESTGTAGTVMSVVFEGPEPELELEPEPEPEPEPE